MRHLLLLILASGLFAQNPNSAIWPGGTAADGDLFVLTNLAQGTLNGNINASVTTIAITGGNFVAPVIATIGTEIVHCTGFSGGNLTGCTRGAEGTTAASHLSGVIAYGYISAWLHNQVAAEIKAIEANLSALGLQSDGSIVSTHSISAPSLSLGSGAPTVSGGTSGADGYGEGTAPTTCAASAVDCVYGSSARHGLLASYNNDSYAILVRGPSSSTASDVPCFAGTNGDLLSDCGNPKLGTPQSGTLTNADGYLWKNLASPPFVSNPQTTTYQVLAADFQQCKQIPISSGTFTITLVASGSQPLNGACIYVLNYGSGVVTIARSGQNINGGTASYVVGPGSALLPETAKVTSDGTNYSIGGSFTNPLTTAGDILGAGTNGLPTRIPTGTAKQIFLAGTPGNYITFPDYHYAPAANCANTTAGNGWSTTGATPTATCRAGTNNKNGYYSWGASDVGSFDIAIPNDWDGSTINLSMDVSSSDATNAHTVIMQAASGCQKGDGSTTDDVAYNTAQSFSTVTLNGNANRSWQGTLSSLTTTGCTAGSVLRVKISRTTDTATDVKVWGVGVTFGRLLTLQAN